MGRGHRKQAIIRECHEAAAMDIAHAVEMLFLDPEGALHAAMVVHPVPERPEMGLETVAADFQVAAGELTFGFNVQIGAVVERGLGKLVHENGPSIGCFRP